MHFWRIEALKAKLRAGAVDQRAAYGYVLATFLLYAVAAVPGAWNAATDPRPGVEWVAYAGQLLLVGTGTYCAFRANGGREGADFALRYLALGWVLGVRLVVLLLLPGGLLLLAAAGVTELAGREVPGVAFDWAVTFLGLALGVVFYWRLARHVREVARGDLAAAASVQAAGQGHSAAADGERSALRTRMDASRAWTMLQATGIVVCVIALLSMLALQSVALLRIAHTVDDLPTAPSLASILVDEVVEAGVVAPAPRGGDPLVERRRIVLTNAINDQTTRVVVEQLLLLDSLERRRPIDLYLASRGGWGVNAFTIIDAMHSITAPVNAHAIGYCFSSCALILTAATGTRTAAPQAFLMVHANLSDSSDPKSYDHRYRARYEGLWRQYAGLPDDWFPMTRDRSYYLTPQEALELGIIDRIAPARKR